MSYFAFNFINRNKNISKLLKIQCNDKDEYIDKPIISKTMFFYLKKSKQDIDKFQNEWDNIKKYVNPYEYIHTQIPDCKSSVSKAKPISRSYYKLIEIIHYLNLLEDYENEILSTFHLAEGPGGFMEAIIWLRSKYNVSKKDSYYGMTLINQDDSNIPGWKKNEILKRHLNVQLITGKSKDGDLLKSENLQLCYDNYVSSMNIITGDGGFDFSVDFNKQELLSCKLILAQILYAIIMQKKGGTFIIKFFDIFYKPTCDMIYMLSCFYDKIFIMKPNTSRYANSERYVICKSFKDNISKSILLPIFINIIKKTQKCTYITNILDFELPNIFITKLEEVNAVLGQQQLDCINNTIQLLENSKNTDKLEQLKQANIQKCINWCTKFNIPCHKIIQQTNIFLLDRE